MLKTRIAGRWLQVEAQPMLDYLTWWFEQQTQYGWRQMSEVVPVTDRTIFRWRRTGWIGVDKVDELATFFGLHPDQLYPGWVEYFSKEDEEREAA